jgi:hypothetical protein
LTGFHALEFWENPVHTSILSSPVSDTNYFHITLARYRKATSDPRPADELPVRVLSQILQDAQALKLATNMEAWIRRGGAHVSK